MRVLVCGSTGCIGSALVRALRSRGHVVVEAARRHADGARTLHLDFMQPCSPQAWEQRLRPLRLDAVVNAVGILMPARGQCFERVHAEGPIELFRGASRAGVPRIVQISALGVGHDADALARPYLASKLRESLWSIVRVAIFFRNNAEEWLPPDVATRLRTLVADARSLTDHDAYLSSKINLLLDATLGLINIQQNAIIKIFSVAAVVFMPPTLIASIYGMNFHFIPELDWPLGYLWALSLMVLSAIVPYLYFKFRRWL